MTKNLKVSTFLNMTNNKKKHPMLRNIGMIKKSSMHRESMKIREDLMIGENMIKSLMIG
jgi:hypothetical protein